MSQKKFDALVFVSTIKKVTLDKIWYQKWGHHCGSGAFGTGLREELKKGSKMLAGKASLGCLRLYLKGDSSQSSEDQNTVKNAVSKDQAEKKDHMGC